MSDGLLDRTLLLPIAAVRPYLLLRGTLLLLAFDMWLTRIEHGGRYGAGGFNVAHFAWLDAIQPEVSAGLYVGLCTLTGIGCFWAALVPRPPRALLAALLALHTWSWAMSMLDSYQHHYLLSIALGALVFFPRHGADAVLGSTPAPLPPVAGPPSGKARPASKAKAKKQARRERAAAIAAAPAPEGRGWLDPPRLTRAWAYGALSASVAVVYAYAEHRAAFDRGP